jgi:hypothetical protein
MANEIKPALALLTGAPDAFLYMQREPTRSRLTGEMDGCD